MNVPFVTEEVAADSVRQRKPDRTAAASAKKKPRVYVAPWKGSFAAAAAVVILLGAAGLWVNHERQKLGRAKEREEKQAAAAEVLPDTASVETAAEESVEDSYTAEQVTEAPPAVVAEEPPGEAELIARLASVRDAWPAQLSLTKETRFPAFFQGREVGEVKVPAGTKVDLVEITEESVEVRFRDGTIRVPHNETSLAEAAAAAVSKPSVVATAGEPDKAQDERAVTAESAAAPAGRPDANPALVAAARETDRLIRASLAKRRVSPPEPVDDERFLRRAYVVAAGRIPTSEEAETFLADTSPHKRANVVARLMRSPGYTSQMTNWMFDRLRIVDYNKVAQIRYPLYRQWVKDAVAGNMPWDKMVNTLLTAQGGGWDAETAPVGYFTRDRGMPLDNLAITMRVFLGSRMECAQCHNDPFGDTKQRDFFRLAAFTSGLEPMKQDLFRGIFQEMNAQPQDSAEHQAAWILWRDVYGNSLAGGGAGRIALPADYQYKDARPGDILGARAPFGKATAMAAGRRDRDDGRQRFAEWMTSGTGDRFPAMIANSMWRKVMGTGFFEPGDEYIELEETHEPAVSRHLADLMVKLGYNLRDFQEVLMLTDAFQAAPKAEPSSAIGGADDVHGRRVHRLSAEQVWDSLVTLISGNPDNQPPRAPDDRIFFEGRPVLEGRMTMTQLSREVLAIEDEDELRDYFAKFVEKVKTSREEPPDKVGGMAMMQQRDPVGFVRDKHPRASELPSPAPPNHFVALFGQSGRDLVDGASREPNMGQVLSLMNGFVQRELVANREARLNADLLAADTPEEKIRRLYLSIFSREPDEDEAGAVRAEFDTSPGAATGNIASAMIMSAEFLYLQ